MAVRISKPCLPNLRQLLPLASLPPMAVLRAKVFALAAGIARAPYLFPPPLFQVDLLQISIRQVFVQLHFPMMVHLLTRFLSPLETASFSVALWIRLFGIWGLV